MRIYKTKWLARFARQEGVDDASLREAIERAARGLVDADLGCGIIKQRVARVGQGRSGGYRMLIAFRIGDRAVFIYGFAQRKRDNISPDELLTLQEIGSAWLVADEGRIEQAVKNDVLHEVDYDDDKK
jgi:hypothetical protein